MQKLFNPLLVLNSFALISSTSGAMSTGESQDHQHIHQDLNATTTAGAVGLPRTKTTTSASIGFHSSSNTRKAPLTTMQNITSRISKLEKNFTDEKAPFTSITAGIHSQYFFLYDKIHELEAGNSDAIIWKIPSVTFVFGSANVAPPSTDPIIKSAKSFSSPIFKTHPHGYNFFVKFYLYGFGPIAGKCASILFIMFPGDYDKLLQWPFSKLIHIGIRDQLDPMNT